MIFYKNISRTSAVGSTNFGSILIFASCVVCYYLSHVLFKQNSEFFRDKLAGTKRYKVTNINNRLTAVAVHFFGHAMFYLPSVNSRD